MNAEFIQLLRYAKWSCMEVHRELYVALDEAYILPIAKWSTSRPD